MILLSHHQYYYFKIIDTIGTTIKRAVKPYYIPSDTVTKISRRLSSDLCAVTTGAFSKRTYYTTADETYLKFRRCFSLSSIGPSLIEDDALQRSITIKLPKIEKQNRKTEEEILTEFDNMLPQLLGYIFLNMSNTSSEELLNKPLESNNNCS